MLTKMMDGAALAAFIVNVLLFVMEVYATIVTFRQGGLWALQYYTVLSNIMAMFASGLYVASVLLGGRGLEAATASRYVATCMLTLTFLVVVFVLTPVDMKSGIDPIHYYIGPSTTTHHVIAPILSFISFVFLENNNTLSTSHVWLVMGVTIVYFIVILIMNIKRMMVGPYVFFHVYEQSILASVLWFVGIGLFALLMDYLICVIGRR